MKSKTRSTKTKWVTLRESDFRKLLKRAGARASVVELEFTSPHVREVIRRNLDIMR